MGSSCFPSIQGQYCTLQLQLFRVTFINCFVWTEVVFKIEWSWGIFIPFIGVGMYGWRSLLVFCRANNNGEMQCLRFVTSWMQNMLEGVRKLISLYHQRHSEVCFFSWASYQQIDFRSPCAWCGNNPKRLAADATRVGICFKNINLMPLERFDSSAVEIITKNKRFDRCSLPYSDKATETTITQRKLI